MPDYMPPGLPPAATNERERLVRVETMMETVFKAVMGNGQVGLISKVADHDARLGAFDTIYAADQAAKGPLMQEYGALKDTVAKMERDMAGPKERRATGLAAWSALATVVLGIIANLLGVPNPIPK